MDATQNELTREQKNLLLSIATYRVLGAKWNVVAMRVERPEAEVRKLVEDNAEHYEQVLKFAEWDRAVELQIRRRVKILRSIKNDIEEGRVKIPAKAAKQLRRQLRDALREYKTPTPKTEETPEATVEFEAIEKLARTPEPAKTPAFTAVPLVVEVTPVTPVPAARETAEVCAEEVSNHSQVDEKAKIIEVREEPCTVCETPVAPEPHEEPVAVSSTSPAVANDPPEAKATEQVSVPRVPRVPPARKNRTRRPLRQSRARHSRLTVCHAPRQYPWVPLVALSVIANCGDPPTSPNKQERREPDRCAPKADASVSESRPRPDFRLRRASDWACFTTRQRPARVGVQNHSPTAPHWAARARPFSAVQSARLEVARPPPRAAQGVSG